MDAFLTQREFDTWCKNHDPKMDRILDYIETQTAINLAMEKRMTTVEIEQRDYEAATSRRVTWISSVVSAVVGGVLGSVGTWWRG